MKKKVLLISLVVFLGSAVMAQPFNHADTLRGSNGPYRAWWDATHYDLHVHFNLQDSSISGFNAINFKVLHPDSLMQIDLQSPLSMDSAVFYKPIKLDRHGIKKWVRDVQTTLGNGITEDGNAYFIRVPDKSDRKIVVYYHGRPRIAKNPPWDGGIVWARDHQGNPWVSIACQGLGASVWYPCKDYQGDEPDSASIHITAPSSLISVSNGRLRNVTRNPDGTSTYTWAVVNPINNYDLIPYIGKYVHFSQIYKGLKGNLTLDYWVLDSDITKAKRQFTQVPKMMKAFEYWFGPYPFYEDGYKLVEAPYLGMEHQSAVAYGNHFENGYLGHDLSGTGVGLKWDFIIVHESGHEWFGNNITSKDIADMWIHEGFTNYSETLFTEYYYGKKAADTYLIGLRKNIENKEPIITPYGVNKEGPIDMYYKASNMIHTIRQVIDNDSLFRSILWGLNRTFYHQTVTSRQIENYISKRAHIDFSKVFDQYLRTTMIPTLTYSLHEGVLTYKWTHTVKGFHMPVRIYNAKGQLQFIYPTEQDRQMKTSLKALKVDPNFYVYTNQIN